MRSTILLAAAALALAGCSMMPSFGGDDVEAPSPAADAKVAPMAAPAPTPTISSAYEIKHLVRGPVRRVKVYYDGRTIETLTMSKGRTAATTHCCTTEECAVIESAKACTTFKMTCDAKGVCKEDSAGKSSIKL
jgi:hypothetical protein